MTSLSELTSDSGDSSPKYESIHIFNITYTDYNGQLLTHIFGRLQDGTYRHIEVEGHRPSFFIRESAYNKRVKNHHAVVRAERGYQSINGDPLVRIYTKIPKNIAGGQDSSGLRDQFNRTWEADVFYTDRFLIDTGIKTHVRVDRSEAYENESMRADYRVDVSDCEPISDPNWSVEPRTLTVDIEVYSEGEFPEAEDAEWPVTAIATHDNYTETITVWLLCNDDVHECDEDAIEQAVYQNRPEAVSLDGDDVTNAIDDVRVFRDESLLLDDFNGFVGTRRPDVLAGWNSSETDNGDAFDFPYLLNRSKSLNTYSADSWSPMGQVWTTRKGREQNLTVGAKGVTFLDGMTTYKKTLWSEPDGGMGLDNISSIELNGDAAKLDIGDEAPDGVSGVDAINWAWKHDWGLFGKYVIRDVQATVGVDRASGATDLYQNLRTLTGAKFDACHNNVDLLDHYILRFAERYDVVLPTNTKPDRDWYYGGYVRKPKFGRHENAIYPDAKSLYPNSIRTCNISPETLIGTEEDLRESEYTEEDCRWSYIDTRPDNVKKESEPELEKCYYLKPSIKKGFMNEVVDELMEMKEYYDGTELYGPVKQVVNSCFTPDTEVLTPNGVRNITDINVGDIVYSWNPETGEMQQKPVVDTIEKPDYDGELIHIQNQNMDLKVTPDHRFLVNRSRHGDTEWEYEDAGDLNTWTHYETPNEWHTENGTDIETIDLADWYGGEVTDNTVRCDDNNRHNSVPRYYDANDVISLVGWFVTEGSANVSNDGEARGDRINISQYRNVNEENHSNICNVFENLDLSYTATGETIRHCSTPWAEVLVDWCGSGTYNKHLPEWAFTETSVEQKEHLLDVLIAGDGDSRDKSNRYTTASEKLRDDVMRLLWECGHAPMYSWEDGSGRYGNGVWRVRWPSEKTKQSFRMHRDGSKETADNGVYCIQVADNHTLVAGRNGKFTNIPNCYGVFGDSNSYGKGYRLYDWRIGESITLYGQETIKATADKYRNELQSIKNERGFDGPNPKIVGGDTDAVMTTLPFLDNTDREQQELAIELAHEACDRVNEWYSEFAAEMYNVDPNEADEYGYDLNGSRVAHFIELEIESYGPTLYIPEPKTDNAEGKKRYAQLISWDEGDWEYGPEKGAIDENGQLRGEVSYTGIDVVRSDRATVTKELMKDVLSHILRAPTQSDAREAVYKTIEDTITAIRNGETANEWIARPRGMGKPPEQYGSPTNTPMPTYRGAKYANQQFDWEQMDGGSKPQLLYIEKVRSAKYDHTYSADTAEDGRAVDAVAMEQPNRLPEGFTIDTDKMIEKTIEDPFGPILSPLNWSVAEALADTEQVGFADFM